METGTRELSNSLNHQASELILDISRVSMATLMG